MDIWGDLWYNVVFSARFMVTLFAMGIKMMPVIAIGHNTGGDNGPFRNCQS